MTEELHNVCCELVEVGTEYDLKILHCVIQVELMKEMVDRSYEIEENKSGLIIQRAIFGKLCGDERLLRFL